MSPDDERFLRRAIELAASARADGEAPFGSLLVGAGGEILAEDHNTVASENDISAHPELKLAVWAARELDASTAAGATMFTSCQPCAMCAGAIERSGLGRVVFALSSDQLAEIRSSGGARPAVQGAVPQEGGFLFEEARAVVESYVA